MLKITPSSLRSVLAAGFGILLLAASPARVKSSTGECLTENGCLKSDQAEGGSTLLEPGKFLQQEIGPGGCQSFRVALDAQQYAKIIVEQQGIDVAVDLRGPDGTEIAEFDDEITNHGTEVVTI
ncbi:MAG: hypothetical protein ACREAC_13335, partial [Blastocatellia bacterium]